jgi:hypothetical protein
MKETIVASLLVMLLVVASCGGGQTPSAINGHWVATLKNPDGTSAFNFSTQFGQNSGTTVTVSNFVFTSPASCFGTTIKESATFPTMGNGPFGMTITSQGSPSIVLTIQGSLMSNSANESISGTWTLTGTTVCSGSGTFSMIPLPPV